MPPASAPFDLAQAQVRVVLPDGSAWEVPVLSIARERATQRSIDIGRLSGRRKRASFESVRDTLLAEWTETPRLILDEISHIRWAAVAGDARRVQPPRPPDPDTLELAWLEGPKSIVPTPSKPTGEEPT